VGKDFENILDKCIAQIRSGEADVASCLNKYPEYAAQLRPLLEIAVLLHREPQPQPRREAVSRGERILQERVAERRSSGAVKGGLAGLIRAKIGVGKTVIRRGSLPSMHWRLRWVGIVVGIVAATLVGVGVVTASNYSMPGDFLYPLKTARERVQLMLTPSTEIAVNFEIVEVEDTTPPEITITGMTEGQVVVSPDTVTPEFSATDDTDTDPTVVATLNGEVFTSGTVVSEVGEYELVVTAIDASDNEAEEEINFEIVEAAS